MMIRDQSWFSRPRSPCSRRAAPSASPTSSECGHVLVCVGAGRQDGAPKVAHRGAGASGPCSVCPTPRPAAARRATAPTASGRERRGPPGRAGRWQQPRRPDLSQIRQILSASPRGAGAASPPKSQALGSIRRWRLLSWPFVGHIETSLWGSIRGALPGVLPNARRGHYHPCPPSLRKRGSARLAGVYGNSHIDRRPRARVGFNFGLIFRPLWKKNHCLRAGVGQNISVKTDFHCQHCIAPWDSRLLCALCGEVKSLFPRARGTDSIEVLRKTGEPHPPRARGRHPLPPRPTLVISRQMLLFESSTPSLRLTCRSPYFRPPAPGSRPWSQHWTKLLASTMADTPRGLRFWEPLQPYRQSSGAAGNDRQRHSSAVSAARWQVMSRICCKSNGTSNQHLLFSGTRNRTYHARGGMICVTSQKPLVAPSPEEDG